MTEVWAYSESPNAANEAAAAAQGVAKLLNCEAAAVDLGEPRATVVSPGKKVVLRGNVRPDSPPDVAAEAIARAARSSNPSAIIVAGTREGKEVAARVAVKLGWGCLPDSGRVSTDGKRLSAERGEFAGRVLTKLSAALPCVAIVRVGSYPPAADTGGAVTETPVGDIQPGAKVLSVSRKETGKVDLRAAKVIVAAGRGVKKKEDLAMVDALARAMGGTMGCSRPLSSDLGWLPEEYHIGLTGINVRPDLYLAVGISGQLQHVAGIKDSKVIAAINIDKDAPMFQSSDYGIVGDLYQLVPALQRAIESRRP